MSIQNFFKPKDCLPDLKGSLSASLQSQAVALANKEVEKQVIQKGKGKKRGPYNWYHTVQFNSCLTMILNFVDIFGVV